MNFEPEIQEIERRLKADGNTTCTDDIINGLGFFESKHYDMSKLDSSLSYKEKKRIIGRDCLIRKLRDDGYIVWIRFAGSDNIPVIELNEILNTSDEEANKVRKIHN